MVDPEWGGRMNRIICDECGRESVSGLRFCDGRGLTVLVRAKQPTSRIIATLSTVAAVALIVGLMIGYSLAPQPLAVTQPQRTVTTTVTASITVAKGPEILGVYFSRDGVKPSTHLIFWFDRANRSIHVLIYSFTLDTIGDALIRAHRRGVEVRAVLEPQQISVYGEYPKIRAAGIPVRNGTAPGLMHNKIAIIDDLIVITGSYNWSSAADTNNDENMIIIRDALLAQIYKEYFLKVWARSKG